MGKNCGFLLCSRILFLVILADSALFGMLAGTVSVFARTREAVFVQAEAQTETRQGTLPPSKPVSLPEVSSSDEHKYVALTFDDGPHEVFTRKLLDGLREKGVKASFFLMGENIAGKEDLVERMQNEGHLVGNHSFRHVRLTREGADAVCESIEQTQKLIKSITGEAPEYLRPPYGDWNEELECRLALTPVLWSVDSLDWKLKNTDAIVRRVEKSVHNGDIILMHDIFSTSVEAALRLVDLLQSEGYRFVTADELVID